MKLTVKSTAGLKLPPGKCDHIEFDDDIPGFGVRLREGGSRKFVFQYKIGSKQRRISLGSINATNFGKARKTAEDLHAKVRLGHDPAGEKADTKAKAHQTFKAVADEFLNHKRETLRSRSYPDVERHLLVHAKTLHGLQIDKIKLGDIAVVLGTVEKNAAARKRRSNGAVTRNRARTSLSTFFAWGMSEGYVTSNPVMGTRRADEAPRDRVLSPAELRVIWRALPDDQFGSIIKLLALTGQRAGEIAGLQWSEVRDNQIELPGERTKNHRAHIVPLSPTAKAIIAVQPRRMMANGEPRDLIFGTGDGPFSGWSKAKTALDDRVKKLTGKKIPDWTPHDLRRSFATHSAEIGIAPHIIELVLNHISGHRAGVAGIYNRSTNEPERRAALVRWADQLMAWVEGRESNVTSLRRIG